MSARPFPRTCTILLAALATALLCENTVSVRSLVAAEVEDSLRAPYVIAGRGLNHRVWQKVWLEPTPFGEYVARTNSYMEMASGMHYRDPDSGELRESRAEFEITSDGRAVAQHGQHKVVIFPELMAELYTSDGKTLRSAVLALNLYNRETGQSLLVAEVSTNAVGLRVAPNEILFTNAFEGFDCDVRYVYNRGDFRQEISPRERLPVELLAAAGFPVADTVLEIWTEFEAPSPGIQRRIARRENDLIKRNRMREPDLVTEDLDFGAMKMPSGRAYLKGGSGHAQKQQASIYNRWMNLQGRTFLVESVPLDQAIDLFAHVPSRGTAPGFLDDSANDTLYAGRRAPSPRPAQRSSDGILMASTQWVPFREGAPYLVMDYVTINSSFTNYTFQGDTTYYISGMVNLYGKTTFEGNSVLKFAPYAWPNINSVFLWGGEVVCDSDAYRPIVFTARDDNSVGDVISGSSGSPTTDIGNYYLNLYDINHADIHDMRFAYAYTAITAYGGSTDLSHVQINHTYYPFYPFAGSTFRVRNALLYDVRGVAVWLEDSTCSIEHLTVNKCLEFAYKWQSSLAVTNSIFASVTNWGASFTSVGNATNASGNGLFQVVGGGNHYLASNSTNRNAGTTNLSSATLDVIRKRTTHPPIVYSNATINVNLTLSPQAQRDTDIPDRGYHYAPLDYVFGGSHLYGNMTVAAGTGLGWFHTSSGWQHAGHGIHVGDGKTVSFEGTVTAPTYWVRANTVQETYTNVWTGGYGPGGITSWATTLPNFPEVRARFLKCSMIAGEAGVNHFRDDWGGLILRTTHCEFYGGNQGGYGTMAYHTNTLFHRVIVWRDNQDTFPDIVLRNCTFYGGHLGFSHRGGTNWYSQIKDTVFDGATVNTDGPSSAHPLWDYDYNSTQSTNRTKPAGASDVLWTNYNWKASSFGNFYLPSNSVLVNTGSVNNASLAGLYHYTTQTNQTKEATSRVDIGYHYVAADANGNPIDTDFDGIPDYLEDINGDGNVGSGETDWQSATDVGLGIKITKPTPSTNLP